MRSWIPHLSRALTDEIAAVLHAGRTTTLHLSSPAPRNPDDVGVPGVSAVWFNIGSQDGYVPVGGMGTIRSGGRQMQAVIVAVEPGRLLLSIEHPREPLSIPPSAEFNVDPTQLLLKLRSRLQEAEAGEWNINWPLLEKVAGLAETHVSVAPMPPEQLRGLSEEQSSVVATALGSEVLFVQGPPGTGKTHTVAALVDALTSKGESVLVASHTHVAVDQAMLKLIERTRAQGARQGHVVRFGEPRLDGIPTELLSQTVPNFIPRPAAGFATLAKVYVDGALLNLEWDAVIVDEASMANAALALLTLGKARRRVVVVGDPHQLPPIFRSDTREATHWLGRDLFEMCAAKERDCFVRLSVQRRMRPEIADIARSLRYGPEELRDHPSVLERDTDSIPAGPLGRSAVVRIRARTPERSTFKWRTSRWNLSSALATVEIARQIAESTDLGPEYAATRPIGLITPFSAQRRLLLRLATAADLLPWVLPGTVHTFQGNECRFIIFDPTLTPPVRTARLVNPEFREGVTRELNVAVTRARDQFALLTTATLLGDAPNASGLALLGDAVRSAPRVDWSPATASETWIQKPVALGAANEEDSVPASKVAYVFGFGSGVARTRQVEQWLDGGIKVVVVDKPKDLPRNPPNGVVPVGWKDKVPHFVLTDRALVGLAKPGKWLEVRNEEVAKFLSSLLRMDDIRAHIEQSEMICPHCGSTLELTHQLGKEGLDDGNVYFVCPRYGSGCEGHIEGVDSYRIPTEKVDSYRIPSLDRDQAELLVLMGYDRAALPPIDQPQPVTLELSPLDAPPGSSIGDTAGNDAVFMIPLFPCAAELEMGLIFRREDRVTIDAKPKIHFNSDVFAKAWDAWVDQGQPQEPDQLGQITAERAHLAAQIYAQLARAASLEGLKSRKRGGNRNKKPKRKPSRKKAKSRPRPALLCSGHDPDNRMGERRLTRRDISQARCDSCNRRLVDRCSRCGRLLTYQSTCICESDGSGAPEPS